MTLRIGAFGGSLSGAGDVRPPFTPIEVFAQQFPKELTRFSSLAGMAVGGLGFRIARQISLGLLGRWTSHALTTGLRGRLLSATGGTLAEAPLFNGVAGLVERLSGSASSYPLRDHWQETAVTWTMLASLRAFGFAGQRVSALAKPIGLGMRLNPVTSLLIPASFQIVGLHFSHQIQKKFNGLDPRLPDPTMTDHLATLIQFHGMGVLLRGVLGAHWSALERAVDRKMESQLRLPEMGDGWRERPVLVSGAALPIPEPPAKLPANICAMEQHGTGSKPPKHHWVSGPLERPAIATPKRIFPSVFQSRVELPEGTIFLEQGSKKGLPKDPATMRVLENLADQVRAAFSPGDGKFTEKFSGFLSQVLRDFPGILPEITKELSNPGYKIWLQLDADQAKLLHLVLLDGFDRPRHVLATLPHKDALLQLRVDIHGSGLPMIQGAFLTAALLGQGPAVSKPIRRVRYDGLGEDSLGMLLVEKELFKRSSSTLSFLTDRELPIVIQYSIAGRTAQWEWWVPRWGPLLRVHTRYEDFQLPAVQPPEGNETQNAVAAKPTRARARPTPRAKPKKISKSNSGAAPTTEPAPQSSNVPRPGLSINLESATAVAPPWPERIQGILKSPSRWKPVLFRDVLLEIEALSDGEKRAVHPLIHPSIPSLLRVSFDGPSFVAHYGKSLPPDLRYQVALMVLPELGLMEGRVSVAAFDVIRSLSPYLNLNERTDLLRELGDRYPRGRGWNGTLGMVHQARLSLESPPSRQKIPPPTFL